MESALVEDVAEVKATYLGTNGRHDCDSIRSSVMSRHNASPPYPGIGLASDFSDGSGCLQLNLAMLIENKKKMCMW